MDEQQKLEVIAIIASTLGVDDESDIKPESEFIADLNGSLDEIQTIIKSVEVKFDIDLSIVDPTEIISVAQLFEHIEEAFI